jgi:hypothetical protein
MPVFPGCQTSPNYAVEHSLRLSSGRPLHTGLSPVLSQRAGIEPACLVAFRLSLCCLLHHGLPAAVAPFEALFQIIEFRASQVDNRA